MQIPDWLNIFRKRQSPSLLSLPSHDDASSESLRIAAPGREEQSTHFFAAFVDSSGNPLDFPGIGNVLKMTLDGVRKIRKSDDFLDQLNSSVLEYSKPFTWYFEFGAYPLFMIWMPEAEGWDLATFCFNSISFDENGIPNEKPPCTLLLCGDERMPDQGARNAISGMWNIDDASELLARYRQRPLALIITVDPGDPLSAAALTFAGTRYLSGLTVPDTTSKI